MSPTATQGRRTREDILAFAVDLASEEGLERLTIGRIATELGMSKSGVFGHFGSKLDLQLATVDAAALRFVAEVVDPVRDQPPGAPRLRALCERYVDFLERAVFPGGCFWAQAASEFDGRPGPVRDAIQQGLAAWLTGLEREAAAAGADDSAQLAFELHSLAQGANTTFQLFGDDTAFRRARAAISARLP